MKHGIPLDEKDLSDIEKCDNLFIAGVTPAPPKPPTKKEKQKMKEAVKDKQRNGIPLDEKEKLFEDRRFTRPLTVEETQKRREVVRDKQRNGIPLDEKERLFEDRRFTPTPPKPPTVEETQKMREAVRNKQKNGIPLDEKERLFEDRRITQPLTDEEQYQRRKIWRLNYKNKLRAEQGLPLLTLDDVWKNGRGRPRPQKKTEERTLPVIEPVKYIMNVEVKKTKTKKPVQLVIVEEVEIIDLTNI